MLNEYFTHYTYSIGPKDLKRSTDVHKKVDEAADTMMLNIRTYIEKIHISKTPCDNVSFENFVNKQITLATDTSETLLSKNEQSRFKPMIESGSKGKKKKYYSNERIFRTANCEW